MAEPLHTGQQVPTTQIKPSKSPPCSLCCSVLQAWAQAQGCMIHACLCHNHKQHMRKLRNALPCSKSERHHTHMQNYKYKSSCCLWQVSLHANNEVDHIMNVPDLGAPSG